jgi:ABC-type sugar transport system ATPase subunit
VLADRIAVLRDGRIEQVGTPDQIWRTPATLFVARFVGSPAMNVLPGDGPLVPDGARGPVDPGHRIGFRPEAVRLGDTGALATVERVDVVGEDAYAYLRLADGGAPVTARVPASARPVAGAAARVAVGWADVHLFDAGTGHRVPWP